MTSVTGHLHKGHVLGSHPPQQLMQRLWCVHGMQKEAVESSQAMQSCLSDPVRAGAKAWSTSVRASCQSNGEEDASHWESLEAPWVQRPWARRMASSAVSSEARRAASRPGDSGVCWR